MSGLPTTLPISKVIIDRNKKAGSKGPPFLFQFQFNIVLSRHAPHVHHRIAHTSQGGVDAHVRNVGNLFERHLLIETHEDDFALWSWQVVHYLPHVVHNLAVDISALDALVLHVLCTKVGEVVVCRRLHDMVASVVAVAVHDDVMSNAYAPRAETARRTVSAIL